MSGQSATKRCCHCKEEKQVTDFYKNGFKKDGSINYNSWCKSCRLKLSKVKYKEGNKYFLSVVERRSKTPRSYLSYLLSKAKKRRECSITLDDLENLYNAQNGNCALTGRKMTYYPNDKNVMSIDRIDSSYGYTLDNVQLVCKEANILKWNLSKEDLIALCKEVIKHNG